MFYQPMKKADEINRQCMERQARIIAVAEQCGFPEEQVAKMLSVLEDNATAQRLAENLPVDIEKH